MRDRKTTSQSSPKGQQLNKVLRKEKERRERSRDGFLTDLDIKRIRKKLGLTQRELAEKLGVGEKNFARYENLSVRQSRAMDNLLRILDAYPTE